MSASPEVTLPETRSKFEREVSIQPCVGYKSYGASDSTTVKSVKVTVSVPLKVHTLTYTSEESKFYQISCHMFKNVYPVKLLSCISY